MIINSAEFQDNP